MDQTELARDEKYRGYALSGDLDSLKGDFLAGCKIEFNSRDLEGNSQIILASQAGHLVMVEFLLTIPDIDINLTNFWGNSSLYLASSSGHLTIVELLIKNGAKVTQTNKRGLTPLCAAIVKQHQPIVECLLKNESPLESVLHIAVRERINKKNQRSFMVGSKVFVDQAYAASEGGVITRDRGDDTYDIKYHDGRRGVGIEKEDISLDLSEDEKSFQDDGELAIVETLLINGANVNEINDDITGNNIYIMILILINEPSP